MWDTEHHQRLWIRRRKQTSTRWACSHLHPALITVSGGGSILLGQAVAVESHFFCTHRLKEIWWQGKDGLQSQFLSIKTCFITKARGTGLTQRTGRLNQSVNYQKSKLMLQIEVRRRGKAVNVISFISRYFFYLIRIKENWAWQQNSAEEPSLYRTFDYKWQTDRLLC